MLSNPPLLDGTGQEMTLKQWVDQLPKCHRVHKDYAKLVDALHRLYGITKYLHPDDVQEHDADFEKQYGSRMLEAFQVLEENGIHA